MAGGEGGGAMIAMPVVLIVDDTPPGAQLLADLVRLAGGSPTISRSGGEALAAAIASRPALVIMDLRLPDGDGRVWAARLRDVRGMAEVPIWACTGLSAADLIVDAWDDPPPFSAWIEKPFDAGKMISRIRTLLSRR